MKLMIGIIVAAAFVLGGGVGYFSMHELAALPVMVMGVIAFVYLLTKRLN